MRKNAIAAVLLFAMAAFAGRPAQQLNLFLLLNGTPVALGVIVSAAGASTTNASTAAPFTITSGSVLRVVCDIACVLNVGATASTTITSSNYGKPCAAGVECFVVVPEQTSAITLSMAASGACNANVAVMR